MRTIFLFGRLPSTWPTLCRRVIWAQTRCPKSLCFKNVVIRQKDFDGSGCIRQGRVTWLGVFQFPSNLKNNLLTLTPSQSSISCMLPYHCKLPMQILRMDKNLNYFTSVCVSQFMILPMDRLLTGGWIYDVELSKPPKNGNGLLCLMFAIKICLSTQQSPSPKTIWRWCHLPQDDMG